MRATHREITLNRYHYLGGWLYGMHSRTKPQLQFANLSESSDRGKATSSLALFNVRGGDVESRLGVCSMPKLRVTDFLRGRKWKLPGALQLLLGSLMIFEFPF